jgi:renalase
MRDKLKNVALIGSGMAGASCARELVQHGFSPNVYDKSHGLGGRIASRQIDGSGQFDHGTQFLTARSLEFKSVIKEFLDQGNLQLWEPILANSHNRKHQPWFVGKPKMNAFFRQFLAGAHLRLSEEVNSIRRQEDRWLVTSNMKPKGDLYDIVICTLPAPQARVILKTEREIVEKISGVKMAPCVALLLTFEEKLSLDFDVWRSEEQDISWVARNNSKPARGTSHENWVVHGSAFWSEKNLELSEEEITRVLIKKLSTIFGIELPGVIYSAVHYWRYSKTVVPLGRAFVVGQNNSIYVGGDWCLGDRVENAFESGRSIAKHMIDSY